MKIADLKKGDKLFCIKTFTDNLNRTRFIKNKYYTISSKIGFELTLNSEIKEYFTIYKYPAYNTLGDLIQRYYEDFLDEYFITDIQARKIKLEQLEDNTFNKFLKNLKK